MRRSPPKFAIDQIAARPVFPDGDLLGACERRPMLALYVLTLGEGGLRNGSCVLP